MFVTLQCLWHCNVSTLKLGAHYWQWIRETECYQTQIDKFGLLNSNTSSFCQILQSGQPARSSLFSRASVGAFNDRWLGINYPWGEAGWVWFAKMQSQSSISRSLEKCSSDQRILRNHSAYWTVRQKRREVSPISIYPSFYSAATAHTLSMIGRNGLQMR